MKNEMDFEVRAAQPFDPNRWSIYSAEAKLNALKSISGYWQPTALYLSVALYFLSRSVER